MSFGLHIFLMSSAAQLCIVCLNYLSLLACDLVPACLSIANFLIYWAVLGLGFFRYLIAQVQLFLTLFMSFQCFFFGGLCDNWVWTLIMLIALLCVSVSVAYNTSQGENDQDTGTLVFKIWTHYRLKICHEWCLYLLSVPFLIISSLVLPSECNHWDATCLLPVSYLMTPKLYCGNLWY